VVDLSSEQHLWRNHWVLFREEKFAIEESTFIRSISWSSNLDVEVSEVLFVWLSVDSNNYIKRSATQFTRSLFVRSDS
jgi:hypothetical protein